MGRVADQADLMLAALRSAGAEGMTRVELFEASSGRIVQPDAAVELLRERGNSVLDQVEGEHGEVGPESWITTRYTLIVDNEPAQALFDGELAEAA